MADSAALFRQGLNELGVAVAEPHVEQALAFLQLLAKWNRVYNLTSIDSPEDMVRLHLLDSLAILPYLHGSRILDVGTGAGLPGIPLAIFAPHREFVLLDSNSKKTRFVTQAVIELGLSNVTVAHSRIENYQTATGFTTVLCRAFASLGEIVTATRRLLLEDGQVLAQKGKLQDDELNQLQGFAVATASLAVPGLVAARHLVIIKIND